MYTSLVELIETKLEICIDLLLKIDVYWIVAYVVTKELSGLSELVLVRSKYEPSVSVPRLINKTKKYLTALNKDIDCCIYSLISILNSSVLAHLLNQNARFIDKWAYFRVLDEDILLRFNSYLVSQDLFEAFINRSF